MSVLEWRHMAEGSVLRDLWNHHAWADAEHWGAFEAFPRALEDRSLLERLRQLQDTECMGVASATKPCASLTQPERLDPAPS